MKELRILRLRPLFILGRFLPEKHDLNLHCLSVQV